MRTWKLGWGLVLGLAACGDNGGGETGSAGTGTSTTDATGTTPTTGGETTQSPGDPGGTTDTGPDSISISITDTGPETDTGDPPSGFRCLAPPNDAVADLPAVQIDTAYPALTGQTLHVAAGGDLQAAIDAAAPGDEITLAAGASFTGNFVLPEKAGDGWIVIRSDAAGLPPEHTRVSLDDAVHMATLVTPSDLSVVSTAGAAHHFRFVGIEFRPADGVSPNDLIVLGDGGATSVDQLAHDLVFDRCIVRGDPATGGKRGIQLNARSVGVVQSYFTDWKREGQDTQTMLGWNTPGPFRIVDNHLEGAGENIMFGGADAKIADVIPSDIEICGNHFTKPLRWKVDDPGYEGTHWSVKNLFELKVGRRVLISGNTFEQVWADAQTGFAIVLKSANQDGGQPWAVTEHVNFVYNEIRMANNGIAVSRTDGGSLGTNHVRIAHNVITDIGAATWGGGGRIFQLLDGVADVKVVHNTGFGISHAIIFDGAPLPALAIEDNILGPTTYGVFGSGQGEGSGALGFYAPGGSLVGNVIVGASMASYPAGNSFPATVEEVGFVDLAGGNLGLVPGSTYAGAASDGTDPGASIELVAQAKSGQ
ncbi:MAG TPA: hypothetical protein VGB85_06380 [Nannocystis sp.]